MRDINLLVSEMQSKANFVMDYTEKEGVETLIYCTLRPLKDQAIAYRQSRLFVTIKKKMDSLTRKGYSFLADILESVGPQEGPHITNAAPGESFHNYAEAWDGAPVKHGKILWDTDTFSKEWGIYGEAVRKSGAFWAGDWKNFKEFPHAQLHKEGNTLDLYSPQQAKTILTNLKLL